MDIAHMEREWAILGKAVAFLGVPTLVALLGFAFWLGQVSFHVDKVDQQTVINASQIADQLKIISGTVTVEAQHTEALQATRAEVTRLQNAIDRLIERSSHFTPGSGR